MSVYLANPAPVVGLAVNLTGIVAHLNCDNETSAKALARRVTLPYVEDDGSADLQKVLEPWHRSSLRHSLERFGHAPTSFDNTDKITREVDRLKVAVPDLRIHMMEVLFSKADAIHCAFVKRLLRSQRDKTSLQELSDWLARRLDFFDEMRGALSAGLNLEEEKVYRAYDSSSGQPLVAARCIVSGFLESPLPIADDNKILMSLKEESRHSRAIDEAHRFVVTPSRAEFTYGLFSSLFYQAKNIRWEQGKLVFEQSRAGMPLGQYLTNTLKRFTWPPSADDARWLSFQRVAGWKIDFVEIGDRLQITIDFGKNLRTQP